jgi:uncharacterized protein (DUF924 family)
MMPHMTPHMTPQPVLRFWFEDIPTSQWWKADPAFDEQLRQRFGAVHEAASRGELQAWRSDLPGRLAEIIVLDQFSRNLHRGMPRAFACDGTALVLSQEAMPLDQASDVLTPVQRAFLYMPFMHSESRVIHGQAERLFRERAPDNLDAELRHKAIVDRFGRYPHRNAVLGRESTVEEIEFLKLPGSGF